MRLSWNEVRTRAAAFANDWKDAAYEKGETQSFYNDFFEIFDVRRRSVARYEEHVAKLHNRRGYIDLFWPGVLLVEQKSAGRDLAKAYQQAGDYFDALNERDRPRYILVSDFQTFELHDLDERDCITGSIKIRGVKVADIDVSNVQTPTPNACSTFRRRTVSPFDPTDFDTPPSGRVEVGAHARRGRRRLLPGLGPHSGRSRAAAGRVGDRVATCWFLALVFEPVCPTFRGRNFSLTDVAAIWTP